MENIEKHLTLQTVLFSHDKLYLLSVCVFIASPKSLYFLDIYMNYLKNYIENGLPQNKQ